MRRRRPSDDMQCLRAVLFYFKCHEKLESKRIICVLVGQESLTLLSVELVIVILRVINRLGGLKKHLA
jgi:hypothetical protein